MPQRFLKPGIRNSERWNSASPWAQSLYIRILTLVDDYGRYDGRNAVIWSECFAIWNDLNPKSTVSPQDCAGFCSELLRAKLVDFYENEGKKCLQVLQWTERVRDGSKEKWPANPNPLRIPADSCGFLPSPSPSPSPSPHTPSVNGNGVCHELRQKLNSYGHRTDNFWWSSTEEHLLVEIARRPDALKEFDILMGFRKGLPQEKKDSFPQSIESLLNGWQKTLDRAKTKPRNRGIL